VGLNLGAIGSQFAIWLWFGREVSNLAFSFYLSSFNQNPVAVVQAEGNAISNHRQYLTLGVMRQDILKL
jgi:hypothetical protein